MDYSTTEFKKQFLVFDNYSYPQDIKEQYILDTTTNYNTLVPLFKEYTTLLNNEKKTDPSTNVKRHTFTFVDDVYFNEIIAKINQIYKNQRILYTNFINFVKFFRAHA